MPKVGFGFLQHPSIRWARHKTLEIAKEHLLIISERLHGVRIEQRWRCGTVGEREGLPCSPRLPSESCVDESISLEKLRPRLRHAIRIGVSGRAQPVGYDLLHRFMNVVVEEAIQHAC